MNTQCIMCFLLLGHLLVLSESAKILAVLPIPVLSHQMVFRVLMQELARRGHEVTVITSIPAYEKDHTPINYTEISVSDVAESILKQLLTEDLNTSRDLVQQFERTYQAGYRILHQMFELEEIQNLMTKEDSYFDLIFTEDCAKALLIFSHLFKAPVIQISSFGGTVGSFETVGALTHPFLFPLAVMKRYDNLSVWEKCSNLFLLYRLQKTLDNVEFTAHETLKKRFGKDTPHTDELKKNVHMLFLNIHPIWDSNRPVPPNVVYLGGLHQKPQKELPKELKNSLDSSANGAIYVSFGTNVNPALLPPEKLQIFIKVFSGLPYDVYWKWNDENLPGLTKNIKISKWFPQSDLIRHPKVKLFITQGGLQSTDEAITGGVPLIAIPILWDQWYNAEKYVQLKIGLQLNINSINEDNLKDAIETVIGDRRYKENILKLRSVVNDQPHPPLEKAVWWTEYVTRNRGARHLQAPSANIDLIDYYELKLILYITLVFILVFVVILLGLRYMFNKLRYFVKKIKTD